MWPKSNIFASACFYSGSSLLLMSYLMGVGHLWFAPVLFSGVIFTLMSGTFSYCRNCGQNACISIVDYCRNNKIGGWNYFPVFFLIAYSSRVISTCFACGRTIFRRERELSSTQISTNRAHAWLKSRIGFGILLVSVAGFIISKR